jgi:hypothetical protein
MDFTVRGHDTWVARDKAVLAEQNCIICNIPLVSVFVYSVCLQMEQKQVFAAVVIGVSVAVF